MSGRDAELQRKPLLVEVDAGVAEGIIAQITGATERCGGAAALLQGWLAASPRAMDFD